MSIVLHSGLHTEEKPAWKDFVDILTSLFYYFQALPARTEKLKENAKPTVQMNRKRKQRPDVIKTWSVSVQEVNNKTFAAYEYDSVTVGPVHNLNYFDSAYDFLIILTVPCHTDCVSSANLTATRYLLERK